MGSREEYGGGRDDQNAVGFHLPYSGDMYKPMVQHQSALTPTQVYQPGSGVLAEGSEMGINNNISININNINNNNINNNNSGMVMKRKRGRPRKYTCDGSMAAAVVLKSASEQGIVASGKKARGRPPGSSKKYQLTPSGSTGVGFRPHVITVKAGEDVLAKLMSFSKNNTRALCILSANGAISNVTLLQAATSGGTVTYEGRFEILSLSGSFLVTEFGDQRSRTGGLSVSLAGPDGRVLGGGVAGLLTAASSVQVIVGSFITDQKQPKSGNTEFSTVPPKLVLPASGSPPSRGTLSETSGSPLNQSTGAFNNSNPQGLVNMSWR